MPISLHRRSMALLMGAFSALPLLAGCGSELGATVSGQVTIDGKPVGPGMVTFAAERAGEVPAVGGLDDDGSYTLQTNRKPGVAPGAYRVAIQAFQPPEGLAPGERTMKLSKPLIPEKYLQVDSSGLEYTVDRGANVINIELRTDGG
jgi:hypothetical protein